MGTETTTTNNSEYIYSFDRYNINNTKDGKNSQSFLRFFGVSLERKVREGDF